MKKIYCKSKRNYLDDYSHIESRNIDMTLSGKYLYKYPFKFVYKYEYDKYPSSKEINKLIDSIEKKFKVDLTTKAIILGSGTNGLIQNIIKVIFSKEKGDLVTSYLTFNQAEYATSALGSETKRVFLKENYQISLENVDNSIDKKTKLVYICNPNNPTGLLLKNKDIISFANKHEKIYIIIDESNLEYSDNESIISDSFPSNLIILKGFSKAYGLANMRIGYMVCSKKFRKEYLKLTTVNEFSGLACILADKVINSNYYLKNVVLIKKEREYLKKELEKLDIKTIESNSNTLMTETTFDENFMTELSNNDISVVPVFDEKNKLHIRIAVQDKKTNKKFIYNFKKCLKNKDNL